MITIDEEARRNIRHPFNIDSFTGKYKTENDVYIFSSPELYVLEKNLFYLLVNSREIEFDKKYRYKPSYLSYDEYGTVTLSQVLMWVNSVKCIEDFDLQKVIIPTFNAIKEVCKDRIKKIKPNNLIEVNW